jgi:hypothetical protein
MISRPSGTAIRGTGMLPLDAGIQIYQDVQVEGGICIITYPAELPM